mmetsp:Transcript_9657/g.18864  ORF Transcript_9657/g.18864 Transcript_9657/m.18864 type:complete len:108 (-) Transcript_9657:2104-2427(-)
MNGFPVVKWSMVKVVAKNCVNLSIRFDYKLTHGTLAHKETTLAKCLTSCDYSLNCENLEEAAQRLNLAWADRGKPKDYQGMVVKLTEITLSGKVFAIDLLGRQVEMS